MLRTLAVMNQKGGSGKTTTAVNFAAAQVERGQKVLLLDFDPQANATSWLGIRDAAKEWIDVLVDGVPLAERVRSTAVGIDLVPSSAWLRRVDKELDDEPGRDLILRRSLAKLPPGRWDLVVIDCPPALNLLSQSALIAAPSVLVPVEATSMASEGVVELLRTIEKIRERLNPDLTVSGILAFRVDDRRAGDVETVERLRSKFGSQVLRTIHHESARMREAHSHRKPILLYAPTSRAADEFRAIAREMTRRWSGAKHEA